MSAHTPGPWKAVSAAACAEIEVFEIAEVSHMRVIPAAGGWPTAGKPEDDARLIASAPRLLAALRRAASALESVSYRDTSIESALQIANAALAEAAD